MRKTLGLVLLLAAGVSQTATIDFAVSDDALHK